MTFRKLIFWLHLIAGVVAGVVILVMSATGVALAFEKEIVAWAERDARRVTVPGPETPRLTLDELLAKLREARPGERPSGITLDASPDAAVLVNYGRTNSFYLDPFSGVVREPAAPAVREFMRVMIEWHRFLGGHDERRALGKAITGACNVAFLFLAASGLYLWWPRQWTKSALSAVGLMNFKLRGKARDWNWHNAVGLWSAPMLIVLTATAMPISYRWAGDMIYKLTGTEAPAQGGGPGAATPAVEIPTPPPGSKPLGLEAMFAAAQKEFPQWNQIAYRSAAAGGRSGRGGEGGQRASVTNAIAPSREMSSEPAAAPPDSSREANRERRERGGEGRPAAQPVTLSIKEKAQWPLFATTQLTLDPFTGNILRQESFGDQNLGRKIRSWTRYLHTGEALGTMGQALAGLASAGAVLLVWTGFALAWRRFFFKRGI